MVVASVSGYKEIAATANLSDARANSLEAICCFGDIENASDRSVTDSREDITCFGRGPHPVHAPSAITNRCEDVRMLSDRNRPVNGHVAVGREAIRRLEKDHHAES